MPVSKVASLKEQNRSLPIRKTTPSNDRLHVRGLSLDESLRGRECLEKRHNDLADNMPC